MGDVRNGIGVTVCRCLVISFGKAPIAHIRQDLTKVLMDTLTQGASLSWVVLQRVPHYDSKGKLGHLHSAAIQPESLRLRTRLSQSEAWLP